MRRSGVDVRTAFRPASAACSRLALAALLLAACGISIDAEQARVCRLDPAGAQSRRGRSPSSACGKARRREACAIDYVAPASGPPGARALRHLPVRRRGAVAQQGGTRRTRHRGRPAVRRQPLSPEALLSRHPGGRGRRSRQPRRRRCGRDPAGASPTGCSRSWSACRGPRSTACSRSPIALVFGLSGRINLAFGELAAIGSAATVAGASIAACVTASSAPVLGLAAGLVAALFAGAIHSAVGGYFTIGRITARKPAAEPDRDRRAVARS